MSVYQSDKAHAAIGAQVDKPDAREAESIIAAFLVALGELGIEAPSNSYRAVVTRQGLEIEVFDDGYPHVTHYGTPAPVEEIATFLGEDPPALTAEEYAERAGFLPPLPVALPADGESFTAGELDALRVGYRVRDKAGDQWEKTDAEMWTFVPPASGVPGNLDLSAPELEYHWGPLTRVDS